MYAAGGCQHHEREVGQEILNYRQGCQYLRLFRIQDSDENTYNPAYTANFSYWPVVDHYAEDPFLPLDPLEAIMTGMFNR